MSYLESKAMITVLPPTKRGSAQERLLARRSCARASLAQSWHAGVLVSVLAMLDLQEG